MANESNLNHKLTVSEQREGGKKSGQTRKEKKTIRTLLDDIMQSKIKDYPAVENLAEKLGIKNTKTVKELFTLVCTLNTLKKGSIDDLMKIALVLGEDNKQDKDNGILDELSEFLKNETDVK